MGTTPRLKVEAYRFGSPCGVLREIQAVLSQFTSSRCGKSSPHEHPGFPGGLLAAIMVACATSINYPAPYASIPRSVEHTAFILDLGMLRRVRDVVLFALLCGQQIGKAEHTARFLHGGAHCCADFSDLPHHFSVIQNALILPADARWHLSASDLGMGITLQVFDNLPACLTNPNTTNPVANCSPNDLRHALRHRHIRPLRRGLAPHHPVLF